MTKSIGTTDTPSENPKKLTMSPRTEPYPDDALVRFSIAMREYLTVRQTDFNKSQAVPFHTPIPESVENKARFTILAQIIKKELGDEYKYFVKEALRESVKDSPENAQAHFGHMLTFFSRTHEHDPALAAAFYQEIRARKLAPEILELLHRDHVEEAHTHTHAARIMKPDGARYI